MRASSAAVLFDFPALEGVTHNDPIVALGRKNFLFVGDEEHGANLAGLYSLVATCDAAGVDPVEYLKDVLMRVDSHPAARIDDLLPQNWHSDS
jgi:hypothetical protein